MPTQRIKEAEAALTEARESLARVEREWEEFDSPERREERDLARRDWAWRLLCDRGLMEGMRESLATYCVLADEEGGDETWLWEPGILERDQIVLGDDKRWRQRETSEARLGLVPGEGKSE